jgi:hypothetical protein
VVDVSLSKITEFFFTVWCCNDIIVLIFVTTTITIVSDRGEDQRHVGFIDGFNVGVDPIVMVVISRRSNEFSHVVLFLVENDTPRLAGKHFSSDGSRQFTAKPSSRGGKNTRELERAKKLQTKLFVAGGVFDVQGDRMDTERGHDNLQRREENRGLKVERKRERESLQSLLFQWLWQQ